MHTHSRRIPWRLATLILFAVASTSDAAGFSLRRSEATIRARLLEEVPLGSSMNQVEQQIARHGWVLDHIDRNGGFDDQREKPSKVTGAKSIRASLGDYRGLPFMVNVTVFWGFDVSGSLIDIWVWKTEDSL
jgi:hypothetical protein